LLVIFWIMRSKTSRFGTAAMVVTIQRSFSISLNVNSCCWEKIRVVVMFACYCDSLIGEELGQYDKSKD
jgi:hypothetical protein